MVPSYKIFVKEDQIYQLIPNKQELSQEVFNKKEVIEDIRKTEILPNWSNYRKFILLRVNRTNFTVEKNKKSFSNYPFLIDSKGSSLKTRKSTLLRKINSSLLTKTKSPM